MKDKNKCEGCKFFQDGSSERICNNWKKPCIAKRKEIIELNNIFATTDMPMDEYLAHRGIIEANYGGVNNGPW